MVVTQADVARRNGRSIHPRRLTTYRKWRSSIKVIPKKQHTPTNMVLASAFQLTLVSIMKTAQFTTSDISRRKFLSNTAGLVAAAGLPMSVLAVETTPANPASQVKNQNKKGKQHMNT